LFFAQIKATLIQVQSMPMRGFLLVVIRTRIAKIRTPSSLKKVEGSWCIPSEGAFLLHL